MTINIFNLLDENWIPVDYSDGSTGSTGLRRLLHDSDRITDITMDPPIAYAGVLRVALALLMRTHSAPLSGTASQWADWQERAMSGGPNRDGIDRYCDDHLDRFFLLGDRPFLQDPVLSVEAPKGSSTNKLRFDQMAGNNPLFWTKTPDEQAPVLAHDEAARWLIVQWFYAAGGRCATRNGIAVGKAGTLRSRSQYFVQGGNFWATLVANAVRATGDSAIAGRDRCWWEDTPDHALVPGTLLRLTASTRGVLLVGDHDGVRGAHLTWGAELSDDFLDADPYSARVVGNDGATSRPYRSPSIVSVWRDAAAILSMSGVPRNAKERLEPPPVLAAVPASFDDLGLCVVTHDSDKSKDLAWSNIVLPDVLRCREALNRERFGDVRDYLGVADEAVRALRDAFKHAECEPIAGPAVMSAWAEAERGFWSVVHGGSWVSTSLWLLASVEVLFREATDSVTTPDRLIATKTDSKGQSRRVGVIPAEGRLRWRLHKISQDRSLQPERQETHV